VLGQRKHEDCIDIEQTGNAKVGAMDYLKFAGATLLSVAVVGIAIKFAGAGIGTFVILGGTIGYFLMFRPAAHAAGYVIWVAAFLAWTDADPNGRA
jgi:hypothetical protein